jgi:hypothetical protein
MNDTTPTTTARCVQFFLGFVVATFVLGAAGELFLRHSAPAEVDVYLGEQSARRGPFVPDPGFGLRYRAPAALYAESAADLAPWLVEPRRPDAQPVWLFIGNSFVHGAGMLVDHVRAGTPDRSIVTMHRTDPLPVRFAQIDVLSEEEQRPERIFMVLTTVDLLGLGEQPLATWRVNATGAITYVPRLPPGPSAWLVERSRLAAAAWFRTGWHRGNPAFDKHALDTRLEAPLAADLQTLFANLARRTRGLPITVIILPSYQQLVRNAGDGFQRRLRAILEPLGYDVFDPQPELRRHPNPQALFLPDKHFSPHANQLVAAALLAHVRPPLSSPAPSGGDTGGGRQ